MFTFDCFIIHCSLYNKKNKGFKILWKKIRNKKNYPKRTNISKILPPALIIGAWSTTIDYLLWLTNWTQKQKIKPRKERKKSTRPVESEKRKEIIREKKAK